MDVSHTALRARTHAHCLLEKVESINALAKSSGNCTNAAQQNTQLHNWAPSVWRVSASRCDRAAGEPAARAEEEEEEQLPLMQRRAVYYRKVMKRSL